MSHRQVKTPRELSVSTGSQGRQVTTGGSSNVNEGTNMSLSERFAMIHKRQKEQKKSSGTPKKNIITKAKSPATKENNGAGIKKRGKGDEKRKTGTPSSDKKTKKVPQSSEKKANKKAQQSSQPRVEKKAQKSEADLDKDLDVYFKNESK